MKSMQQGYTIVEMIVVIAIAVIFISLAIPSYQGYLATQRIASTSFDLITSFAFARNEAIKRRLPIEISPVTGNWTNGWTISISGSNTVLKNQEAVTGVQFNASGFNKVTYNEDGRISGAAVRFLLEAPYYVSSSIQRCIVVGLSGIPKNSVTSNGVCSS